MSEYWKSTPSYWCKFCAIYVRDTSLERKNHEASGKHQNAIQRNLRDLQKNKTREDRDKQRAKDEVARLNGIVSGKAASSAEKGVLGVKDIGKGRGTASAGPTISAAAQRKAHAEQLAKMGVDLPEELKREVTGVGGWQVVSETVVEEDVPQQFKSEDGEEVKVEALARGVRKRKGEGEDEEEDAPKRKIWGSSVRTYPGASGGDGGEEDLDALLSGVVKKPPAKVKKEEESEEVPAVKKEEPTDEKLLDAVPEVDAPSASVKAEADEAVPTVVFKKRKVKR